jgi:hypothetical protein
MSNASQQIEENDVQDNTMFDVFPTGQKVHLLVLIDAECNMSSSFMSVIASSLNQKSIEKESEKAKELLDTIVLPDADKSLQEPFIAQEISGKFIKDIEK